MGWVCDPDWVRMGLCVCEVAGESGEGAELAANPCAHAHLIAPANVNEHSTGSSYSFFVLIDEKKRRKNTPPVSWVIMTNKACDLCPSQAGGGMAQLGTSSKSVCTRPSFTGSSPKPARVHDRAAIS